MKDIFTDAGRTATNRAVGKEAELQLRAALNDPRDEKGRPVALHHVKTLAASAIRASPGTDRESDFEFAAGLFLERLTYKRWGYTTTVSSLWNTFLQLVDEASPDCTRDFARTHMRDFHFCVVGHVQRLNLEYDRLPHALKTIQIWSSKNGNMQVGVQNDGVHRVIPFDEPPAPPMLWRPGSKIPHWIAPEDLKRMRKMGCENFVDAYKSGKIELSPRPMELLTEPTLLNVAPPTAADLVEIRKTLPFMIDLPPYKPKRRAHKSA